ncbi:type 1 glutamine amidotransferase domain-containing protein [Rhodococcus sp. (in: high G+C Gram-positive bacteria)]|uniref:type 1 glutamine amidotransferase domain-containing protein n=1 Tax=Rhodococcus sp. TaxID=1831 RepID=UPI00257AFFFF|nr:type 1 glutamine amidotransferase domain-containing protein [Rhodococcus sp. (in: high G+C Gram-positive bacteria)]MBQ7808498.1 type 1 glutamine amidotransferase domain-containing protein [Rhodococcus sp. (in: high G+C Gram-positive bacteria)]
MTKLLFAVTSADHWTLKDGTPHPTGYWAEELVESHRVFVDAGYEIVIATPGGKAPVVDEGSLAPEVNGGQEGADRMRKYIADLQPVLDSPEILENADAADYDVVFVPGGHGPMEDLAVSASFGELLVNFLDADKVVSAVCHAPAALLPAQRPDGSWLFDGYQLTAFTNEEETQAGLADKAPWLLETRLRELGGKFSKAEAWSPYVVVDRKLYTGQNPASSRPLAERIVADLG